MSSRLDQARKQLRFRLARRGVSLVAALSAVAIAQPAAAVPARLATATVRAGLLFAAGQIGRAASASAVALAEGMLRSTGFHKLTGTAALLLFLAALHTADVVAV